MKPPAAAEVDATSSALIFLNVFQLLFPIRSLIAAFREFPPSLSTLIAGGQTPMACLTVAALSSRVSRMTAGFPEQSKMTVLNW